MSRKKDNNIQIARAVAIIMVTMMHTLPFDMDVQWTILVKILTNSCVAIFVFLSGYLTDINDINIRTIYKRRLSRVLIPYIIWTALYTVYANLNLGHMAH